MSGAESGVLSRQRTEGMAGADLDQNSIFIPRQFSQAVGEAHGLAQVRGPTIGVGSLLLGDPGSGEICDVGNSGPIQFHFSDFGGQPVEHRLHHF